jgi:hypothetical protein
VASYLFNSLDRVVFRIEGNNVDTLSTAPISQPLSATWFDPGRAYLIGGSGVWEKKDLGDPLWILKNQTFPVNYTYCIRGNHYKDVLEAGGFGEVTHFNGNGWYAYPSLQLGSGNYVACAIRNNLAVVVGTDGQHAVAAIGRR